MGGDHSRLEPWFDHFKEQCRSDRSFEFCVHGCGIRVQVDSAELIDSLARYFEAFRSDGALTDIDVFLVDSPPPHPSVPFQVVPPSPGKTRIKDEIHDFPDGRMLRKPATGMLFLFGGPHNLAVGPCLANVNQVINFINNRYVQWHLEQGYLLAHAAGVAHDDQCIAIVGASGKGKSTLALRLVTDGLRFVSNDRLLLRREGERVSVVGLPKHPRVNPGTLLNNAAVSSILPEAQRTRFSGMNADTLWNVEEKYDVPIDQQFGIDRVEIAAELAGVVFLSWSCDAQHPGELAVADLSQQGGVRQDRARAMNPAARTESQALSDRPDLLAAMYKHPGPHFWTPGLRQGAEVPPGSESCPALKPDALGQCLRNIRMCELTGAVAFDRATSVVRSLL